MATVGLYRHPIFSLRALRAFALLTFLLTIPTWGQPLTKGVVLKDTHYLLEGGEVKAIRQGKLESLNPKRRKNSAQIQNPQELVQPSGWTDSFLIRAENGLFQVEEGGVKELVLSDPPGGKLTTFGSLVIWQQTKGKTLEVYSSEGLAASLDVPQLHSGPHLVGDSAILVLNTDQTYILFSAEDWENPTKGSFPMKLESVQVTVSGDQALLWAKDHPELLQPALGITHNVRYPPKRAVKAGRDGRFIVGMPRSLKIVYKSGTLRPFLSPRGLTEQNFHSSPVFVEGSKLHAVVQTSAGAVLGMAFEQMISSGGNLGQLELKKAIIPPFDSAHKPFLFSQTELEEPKIDRWGREVKDPKTGEVEKRTVNGHSIFILRQSAWANLVQESRARLVGPAEMVGPTLIYATQTKPQDYVGVKRPHNGRFPYPKIVLHGMNPSNGTEAWRLELPRGQAPSLARLPEAHWPVLGENGPLLFTTEGNSLAALDPTNGQVLWTTGELALDDSRPPIINWGDRLGLVATLHTTKKLLVFDQQGQRVGEFRLNPIFNSARTLNLLGVIVICLALVVYIYIAGKKKLFIRRIAGLEALDEAVGRATEMGKPVLYVTGLADVDDIQTLASLSILSHVAKKTAEYDASIIATTSRAVTFSAAQEVVRDAFTIAGRPDSFHIDSVQYISDDQFGYAAGVDGIMVREEPAANFYMGKFYAESLIFAETGHSTGAIQIAGTAMPNQLPFFVAACDYTLIGEELFAASAYLSGDPLQVGSLRGQDVGKAIVMILLVLAALLVTADSGLEWGWAKDLTNFFGGWLS